MLAFRSLARAAPRVTSQFTARATRQIQPFRIQPSIALRTLTPTARFIAPFSSSCRKLQGNEDELLVKLESEIQVEKSGENTEEKVDQRKFLEDWIESNGWEIKDVVGEEEVVLTKTHGKETVSITFSIDDINNEPVEEDEAFEEDQALEDEPSTTKPKETEEVLEDAEAEEDAAATTAPFPAKLSINITKEGKPGSLVFEGVSQYGEITIEDFWYFENGKLSKPTSFEDENSRAKVYAGPPFGSLDFELAQMIDQYLVDRGINESLAEFVAMYIEFKEAREYQRWLGNVKSFFE